MTNGMLEECMVGESGLERVFYDFGGQSIYATRRINCFYEAELCLWLCGTIDKPTRSSIGMQKTSWMQAQVLGLSLSRPSPTWGTHVYHLTMWPIFSRGTAEILHSH